jgi:hypothetical protein
MSPRYPVPAFFIDALENVDMIDPGSAIVELSSLGTPIRLRLSLHSMLDLAAMSRKTCSLMLARQKDNVVEFAPAKPKRKRKASAPV